MNKNGWRLRSPGCHPCVSCPLLLRLRGLSVRVNDEQSRFAPCRETNFLGVDHVPGTVAAHLGAYAVEPCWGRVRNRGGEGALFLATARRLDRAVSCERGGGERHWLHP